MARRNDHSRQELKKNILAAAREIVETQGASALTARSLAAAIGYSPGTLYNVFANLETLIIHLNGETLDDLHQTLVQSGAGERGDVTTLVDDYLRFTGERTRRWELLFSYRLPEGEALPAWYQQKIESLLDLFTTTLRPSLPGIDENEIDRAARVLWCGLHGIHSLAGTGKLRVITCRSLPEMAHALVNHYLDGLKQANNKTAQPITGEDE